MSVRLGLRLRPLEVLFCRDGRPFDAASRVEGGMPGPQTLAGALRTALLARHGLDFADFARRRRQQPTTPVREVLAGMGAPGWVLAARIRGPFLALDGDCPEPLLPAPATLATDKAGGFLLARPLPTGALPGWPEGERRPLWFGGEPDRKAEGGFLSLAGVRDFLDGGLPDRATLRRPDELFGFDTRTGIEIDMHALTSSEGGIYGIRLLALKAHVCLYAEAILDGEPADVREWFRGLLPLGGEGRYVVVEPVEPVDWPAAGGGPKRLWLLATPAFVRHDGDLALPDGLPPAQVRAAASGPPVAVSGWDVARNSPRPVRFAVPAGSVYFVDGEDEARPQPLCAGDAADEGWGFALPGRWNDG
jgi:CRISPR-associated protein Cmr3